jgi:integrase/recombinase XerD
MLNLYRRHRAKCKRTARRADCFCPIWVQGVLRDEPIRESLDLTNWEAAQRKIQEWEIHGKEQPVSVQDAYDAFLAHCTSRKLSPAILKKLKYVKIELTAAFGPLPVRRVSVSDLDRIVNGWPYAPSTAAKRIEYIRWFFAFCVTRDFIEKNPAKALTPPVMRSKPTLPFSDSEMEKILWACDAYGEIHPQTAKENLVQLRAIVLLMRHSGLRISDAISLRCDAVNYETGTLFIYQAKTGHPVSIPLPPAVIEALKKSETGDPCYFWNQVGTLQTCMTHWQARLKKLFKIAGLSSAHSHQFRDTFAVSLLVKGVGIETVAMLLGHQNIKITQKHYAPWVKSRQDALEEAVKATWG